MQLLLNWGVTTKRGVSNAHREPAYSGRPGWRTGPGGLGSSERLRDTTMMLPLFHAMTDPELDQLLGVLAALDQEMGRAEP